MSWKTTTVPGLWTDPQHQHPMTVEQALTHVKTQCEQVQPSSTQLVPNPATTAAQLSGNAFTAENHTLAPAHTTTALTNVKKAYDNTGSDWGKVKAGLDSIIGS